MASFANASRGLRIKDTDFEYFTEVPTESFSSTEKQADCEKCTGASPTPLRITPRRRSRPKPEPSKSPQRVTNAKLSYPNGTVVSRRNLLLMPKVTMFRASSFAIWLSKSSSLMGIFKNSASSIRRSSSGCAGSSPGNGIRHLIDMSVVFREELRLQGDRLCNARSRTLGSLGTT